MKFSVGYMLVLISVLSVLSVAADDVEGKKDENSQEKWLGYGGWGYWGGGGLLGGLGAGYGWLTPYSGGAYGLGVYSGGLYHTWFRRSLQEKAETHSPAEATVQCANSRGNKEEFSTQSCMKAATKIATEHLSSATCGKCTIQLRSKDGLITPKSLPPTQLTTTVNNMLKACTRGESKLLSASELAKRSTPEDSANHASGSNAAKDSKQSFAVLLLKGNGPECE